MHTNIRQWGNSAGTIIPAPVLKAAGLKQGDKLEAAVVDGKIVLTPVKQELTLETLLANSPRECFQVTDEDREWLDTAPAGKEV